MLHYYFFIFTNPFLFSFFFFAFFLVVFVVLSEGLAHHLAFDCSHFSAFRFEVLPKPIILVRLALSLMCFELCLSFLKFFFFCTEFFSATMIN